MCYPTLTVFYHRVFDQQTRKLVRVFSLSGKKTDCLINIFYYFSSFFLPFLHFVRLYRELTFLLVRTAYFNDLKEIGNLDLEPFA